MLGLFGKACKRYFLSAIDLSNSYGLFNRVFEFQLPDIILFSLICAAKKGILSRSSNKHRHYSNSYVNCIGLRLGQRVIDCCMQEYCDSSG